MRNLVVKKDNKTVKPFQSPRRSVLKGKSSRLIFEDLARKWRSDIRYISSVTAIIEDPAYKQIISMGKEVVPYILRDLEQNQGYWFHALTQITGENPINAEQRGKVNEMARAWLDWGRNKGYQW
ncbi:MAG TPA: hypothetical protein VMW83_17205 [Spirochaetia bacterium]|nr:hypothetical protein [Spirochaetia bacterium]